jgi:hypothetical protein
MLEHSANVDSMRLRRSHGGRRDVRPATIDDPWGEAYVAGLAPGERRRAGVVYTPSAVVGSMLAWARICGKPARVVDPGAGSGRFAVAAALTFPGARVVAVDIDGRALAILEKNARAAGVRDRIDITRCDYRKLKLPAVEGRTLFIGNPPYVRHHDVSPEAKEWFARAMAARSLAGSRLAGLHVHFFAKTLELAREGDFGAFITAAEWLDVNYGRGLRQMMLDGIGGESIHLIDPRLPVFADAMATAAIACFSVGRQVTDIRMRVVRSLGDLGALSRGEKIERRTLAEAAKWSALANAECIEAPSNDRIELGTLFRVKRGQVTGLNRVWIVGAETPRVPERFLFPAVIRARELIAASQSADCSLDVGRLRNVVDLPTDLSALDATERILVNRFLDWARGQGCEEGYIARHRRAWWAVELYPPAPVLVSYMGRRPPAFALNPGGARHINIAHGLYPRVALPNRRLRDLVAWLNANVGREGGRTYAGGLTKFEPREIERLLVPAALVS